MVKLIVWDLDETLWHGVAYYTDKNSVKLKPNTLQVLKELSKSGFKLAVCSRNNEEDAVELMRKFNILKFFNAVKLGWGHKSEYVLELSRELKTPLNEILFIDDDAFQREEVSRLGVKTAYFSNLLDLLEFLNIDAKRVKLIKEQESRSSAEMSYKGGFHDFLKSCNIKMRVRMAEKEDLKRVVQLLNRTNELNATINRRTLEEVEKGNDLILVAELTDKFGDYGVIGEAIIEEEQKEWFIKDFTISCRTMGRGIGKSLLIYIMNLAKKRGVKKIKGYLKHSSDNWRMRPLYERRGFTKLGLIDGKEFYEFTFKKEIPCYPEWITI